MGSREEHELLVDKIVYEVGSRKDARAWRNDTGIARSIDDRNIIKFGLVGSSDVLGVLNVCGIGIPLALEAKTGKAVQTNGQKAFERMINKFGGFYFLIRPETDITACVEHAKSETIKRILLAAGTVKR